jgi:uncharacterized protein (DUF2141 family)
VRHNKRGLRTRDAILRPKALQRTYPKMKRPAWGIVFFCAAAGLAGPAGAEPAAGGPSANLTIRVENVLPSGGILRLGVYDRGRYPDDNSTPIASANVAAISGETTVILRNLPPGLYAIEAFQDVNANGQMDTSWLGLPQEPFGFSRDAVPFLSKPSFDDVKFTLAAGDNVQILHLQSLIKPSPADRARDAVRDRQQ